MKWTRSLSARRWRVAALGAALLALVMSVLPAAAAAPPKPQSAPEAKAPALPPSEAVRAVVEDEVPLTAAPSPAPAADTGGHGPQPPDGKWLKDTEGRDYFLDKLEKAGPFLRLDDKTVRTRWGIAIDVAKEDDKFFYYKVYKSDGSFYVPLVPKRTPEEEEKILATYTTDTPETHRLGFASFAKGLPTTGQWRNGFDIADMNGDGHLDIVHGPARKSLTYPAIFLGDGKGGWRRWSEAKYPRLPFDYGDAAVADFNGDGKQDLALGMHLRGLVAMLGDGKGNFTEWRQGLDLQFPGTGTDVSGFTSRTLAATDWNRDGRPDILALGEGPRLAVSGRDSVQATMATESYGTVVYLNQGDGTWVRKDQGTSSNELFGESITVADFNGDRRPDFATGTSSMGRRSLVNYSREDGAWNATEIELVRPQAYIRSVTGDDFDGNGLADLAVGYMSYELEAWRMGIDILYAQADGSWTRRPLVAREERAELSALDSGDLDGDGKRDLVALTSGGETWVFYGDGKGFFVREKDSGIPTFDGGCKGYYVQLADFDGDGRDEIVAGFAGENSPMFAPDRCLSGGALKAWQGVPAGK